MKTKYVIGLVGLTALGAAGIAYATPKAKNMLGNFNQTIDSVVLEQDVTDYLTPIGERLSVLEDSFGELYDGISSNQDLIEENANGYMTMSENNTILADRLDKLEQQINSEQKVYCTDAKIPFVETEFLFCYKEETVEQPELEPKIEGPVVNEE
ncbi:hypothetical protein HN385_03910 [archaeon]|jgi:hypothetical protein|nr:hypothetical protein [archaeon]MBT3450894.1 hypothetical protein [archaeon]MBT6869076.1 hypothetical protein [archaeon]MBT7193319.1 hypothetical protein [archaeon]MBT7380327.1 hypothetical protein [archaeon]